MKVALKNGAINKTLLDEQQHFSGSLYPTSLQNFLICGRFSPQTALIMAHSEQTPRQQSLLQLSRNVMLGCDSQNPPLSPDKYLENLKM